MASGDSRLSANQNCWDKQKEMEDDLAKALAAAGYELVRAHPYKPDLKHGFIASQKEGLEVFANIDPKAKLIVAEAVWQYSYHVLPGLLSHQGPILTVANWSGTWPGLVGMLNLNGIADQGRQKIFHPLERGFHRQDVRLGPETVARPKAKSSIRLKHVKPLKKIKMPRPRRQTRQGPGRTTRPRKSDHGHFRRRMHGHVQRHHPGRTAQSAGRVQGAPQPVGPVLRNHASSATTRPARSASGWKTAA